jgi:hypothetical protein
MPQQDGRDAMQQNELFFLQCAEPQSVSFVKIDDALLMIQGMFETKSSYKLFEG